MKKFKLLLIVTIALCFALGLTSCSNDSGGDGGSGGLGGSYMGSDMAGAAEGGSSAPGSSSESDAEAPSDEDASSKDDNSQNVTKPAGLITAAAWNDNDNYDLWKSLFDQNEENSAKFFSYQSDNSWGFSSYHRIKVTVSDSSGTVFGAKVACSDSEGNSLCAAVTDRNGVAYLFTDVQEGSISVSSGEWSASAAFSSEARDVEITLESSVAALDIIDLMFVVDVTGSMGDELDYLKNEIADVVNKVALSNSTARINLALLFYRDHGDSEVFKYYDFTNVTESAGLAAQQAAISEQHASGGGDTPEAVDEALEMAVSKQWSTGATTKIIFHVLDAPPHSGTANRDKYNAAVDAAAEKGIRICPIICSGADLLLEYLARSAALYTGGTFVFITDDSGIGNSHHDPELPNITVEALNSLMVRLINGYHTGTFAPPVYWKNDAASQN